MYKDVAAEGEGLVDGEAVFTNAVEAFSHGRNFNKTKKSTVNLKEGVSSFLNYEGLRKDPVLRRNLLRIEQFFESSQIIDGPSHKLQWYWALHCWWVSEHCQARFPAVTGLFLVATAAHCSAALEINPGALKPLLLWGRSLQDVHEKPGFEVSAQSFEDSMQKFCDAFLLYCRVRPHDVDLSLLVRLVNEGPLLSSVGMQAVGRCLKAVTSDATNWRVVKEMQKVLFL
jgi:hypothetical protein